MAWIILDDLIPNLFEPTNPVYDLLHDVSKDDIVLTRGSFDAPSFLYRQLTLCFSRFEAAEATSIFPVFAGPKTLATDVGRVSMARCQRFGLLLG